MINEILVISSLVYIQLYHSLDNHSDLKSKISTSE